MAEPSLGGSGSEADMQNSNDDKEKEKLAGETNLNTKTDDRTQETERREFSDQDDEPPSGSTDQLSDFDRGQIEMARRLGQSVSKTASLVGCSRSAVISIYQKRRRKGLPVKLCTKLIDTFTEEQSTKLKKKASDLKSKRKVPV